MFSSRSKTYVLILICILLVSAALHGWGVVKDLPLTEEFDEALFVVRAVNVASGDLNPHWFGNPGSTVIYPLAFIYRTLDVLFYNGSVMGKSLGLEEQFTDNPGEFYFQGRLLSVLYSIGALAFLYLIGRRLFNDKIALIATWLAGIYPIIVAHAQMVRTDSAATFFGLLVIWQLLRLYDTPTPRNRILTGAAFGLAVATRYFMATLIVPIVVTEFLIHRLSNSFRTYAVARNSLFIILIAVVAFTIATPYFFLDLPTALRDIMFEGRTENLGAEGFSIPGNLGWYLYSAIPNSITWPQVIFAVIGLALVFRKRQPQEIVAFSFVPALLLGTSAAFLHWQRWVIQILPLVALLTASGIVWLGTKALKYKSVIVIVIVMVVSAWPLYQTIRYNISQTKPSTRIQARQWILQNLPSGSKIAYEFYTFPAVPPAADSGFVTEKKLEFAAAFSLAAVGKDGVELTRLNEAPRNSVLTFVPMPREFRVGENKTISDYKLDGYNYLLINYSLTAQYLKEKERYQAQTDFYQELEQKGTLLQEFKPYDCSVFEFFAGCHGPDIKLYQLP